MQQVGREQCNDDLVCGLNLLGGVDIHIWSSVL